MDIFTGIDILPIFIDVAFVEPTFNVVVVAVSIVVPVIAYSPIMRLLVAVPTHAGAIQDAVVPSVVSTCPVVPYEPFICKFPFIFVNVPVFPRVNEVLFCPIVIVLPELSIVDVVNDNNEVSALLTVSLTHI